MTWRFRMPRAALALASCAIVLLASVLRTSPAAAQQYTGEPAGQSATVPYVPKHPALVRPRLEVAGGVLLTLASVPVAITTLLLKSSFGLGCNFNFKGTSPPDEECERREQREREEAHRAALWAGLPVGLAGMLIVGHGAFRIHRVRAEERRSALLPHAWSVQPSAQRTTLDVTWRF